MAGKIIFSQTELYKYREMLSGLASSAERANVLLHCDTGTWNNFDPRTPRGRQIYNTYTDDELLTVVRRTAGRLGRPPGSTEVYCIYVRYLRYRFGTWPEIIKASGLVEKPEADSGRVSALLTDAGETELRHLFMLLAAREFTEHIPTKKRAKAASAALVSYFGGKENVGLAILQLEEKEKCRICPDPCDSDRDDKRLYIIKEKNEELGRTPLLMELPFDSAFDLWRQFGSWHAVLAAAELKPLSGDTLIRARTEYAMKTASPDNFGKEMTPEMRDDLLQICKLARELGRAPAKGEIPENVFRRINKAFGSYRAIIGFMGIPPLDKDSERRIDAGRNKGN